MPVNSADYYATYHGHEPHFLEEVLQELRKDHSSVVYFAGDSSLDNKYWFGQWEHAVNGYERALQPPRMKADVCHWLNREFVRRGAKQFCCINTSIEATSLNDRACGKLLPQDLFIQHTITEQDTLVVSVGGNDIALAPLLCTVVNLLTLVWCSPQACIEHCACACPPNTHMDAGCCGCGLPACLTATLCGWPLGMGYFVDMFKNRVQNYVERLVEHRKPKKVIVCMIYFLDEKSSGSWADAALKCMCYDRNPSKLQQTIRSMFRLATSKIHIEGTEVVAFPLFEVLDGKDTRDYCQRVEPSPVGGLKMAKALAEAILTGEVPGQEQAE